MVSIMKMLSLLLPILVSLALVSCGGSGGSSGGPCGNDIGNGSEIVHGEGDPDGIKSFDNVMRSLAVHPADENQFWLGTEGNGILKGEYSGGTITWTRQRYGIRHLMGVYAEIFDIAISDANPDHLIAATNMGQGPLNGDNPEATGGIIWSTDGGSTWARKNCGIAQGSVASVAFLPGSTTQAWASTQSGESSSGYFEGVMYYTDDAGENWTEVPGTTMGGIKSLMSKILIAGSASPYSFFAFGRDVVGPSSVGLLSSSDDGLSFSETDGNATVKSLDVSGYDLFQGDGKTLFLTTETDRLYRSNDSGMSWMDFPASGRAIAVSPTDANIIVTGGIGPSAKIYRSTNGLGSPPLFTSVHTTASTTPYGHVDDIVFAPSNSSVVYLATQGYLVYRSADAGATWSLPTNGDAGAWLDANP